MNYEITSQITPSQANEKYGFKEGMPLQVQVHIPHLPAKKVFTALAQSAYELGMKKEEAHRKLFTTHPFISNTDVEPYLGYTTPRSLKEKILRKPDTRVPSQLNMSSYEGIPVHLKVHTTPELKDIYVIDAFVFEQKVAPIKSLLDSLEDIL